MILFMIMMMFEAIHDAIPMGFPSGAEKVKLGYFKELPVSGIYGDMIKLNDGRVLIYRVTGNKTYIFDPKDDTFTRTAKTNAPSFWKENPYRESYYSYGVGPGITLKNGKVLLINPPLDKEVTEYEYYNQILEKDSKLETIRSYNKEKISGEEQYIITYVRDNKPELYAKYLKFSQYQEDAKHAHLYNPETGKMEQIDVPPVTIDRDASKLLMKDGNVLIIGRYNIIVYDYITNKFRVMPSYNKLLGYMHHVILSDGRILMTADADICIYNLETNSLTKSLRKLDSYVYSFVQLKNDKILYLTEKRLYPSSNEFVEISIQSYDPYKDELIKRSINLAYPAFYQLIHQISDDSVIITGKKIDDNYGPNPQPRPDRHVEIFNTNTNESKILTKTTKYEHSSIYSNILLLDDGRLLIQNKGNYELFIPYTYKKQKREVQKRLKQELKNK